MRRHLRALAIVALATLGAGEEPLRPKLPTNLPKTPTPFYDIHSKLDEATLQEAAARLTAIAKDYHRRTAGFPRRVKGRLPVYLFDNEDDYLATNAPEGSQGLFIGQAVLGFYTPDSAEVLWPLLQHECWHQFARYAVGGNWPVWLDEGMAEYYTEAIWTGDEFITGVISPSRLALVHEHIRSRAFKSINRLLSLDAETWTEEMASANYDQAWALVQYLAHGATERHRLALVALIKDASQIGNKGGLVAFRRVFGPRYTEVLSHCEQGCLTLKPDATRDRYLEAIVGTLTSFLARAHAQGLRFKAADDFFAAARDGRLLKAAQASKALWLPKSLLDELLPVAERLGTWALGASGRSPALRLRVEGVGSFTGSFEMEGSRSVDVKVRSVKE